MAELHFCGSEGQEAGSTSPVTLGGVGGGGALALGLRNPSVNSLLLRAEAYFTVNLSRQLASSKSRNRYWVLLLGWIEWSGEFLGTGNSPEGGFCPEPPEGGLQLKLTPLGTTGRRGQPGRRL